MTIYNARNKINWSGLGYHISKALEKSGNNIGYIGELHQNTSPVYFLKKVFYSKVLQKKYPIERTIAFAKACSDKAALHISKDKYDFVFSPGTIPIAYLETDVPKVIYTDATFACMLDYYEQYQNLSSETIRQGHALEKRGLESCALAIFSSEWAAQSAISHYGIDPGKVKVVPFGANFDVDYSLDEVLGFIHMRSSVTLKILFNGVDWKRKGGDLVMSTVRELKNRGLPVELHIVGLSELPFATLPDGVIYHGFLNKSIPAEDTKLQNLYKNCHFLFLPSNAEAFGVVFSEASGYGMPSISKATGGVTTAIVNGKNGYALDPQSDEHVYANLISEIFLDYKRYLELALSSYGEYQNRLNWVTAGNEITRLIKGITS